MKNSNSLIYYLNMIIGSFFQLVTLDLLFFLEFILDLSSFIIYAINFSLNTDLTAFHLFLYVILVFPSIPITHFSFNFFFDSYIVLFTNTWGFSRSHIVKCY